MMSFRTRPPLAAALLLAAPALWALLGLHARPASGAEGSDEAARLRARLAVAEARLAEVEGLLATLPSGAAAPTAGASGDAGSAVAAADVADVGVVAPPGGSTSAPPRATAPTPSFLAAHLLEPVFQVEGDEAVGSGVLVARTADGGGLALSCHHVVRDFLGASDGEDLPVPCLFDRPGEEPVRVAARVLVSDPFLDLALLELEAHPRLGPPAPLADRERLAEVDAFSPVWTVGSPLGTITLATEGRVSRADWRLGSQRYWMVSSPAFYGNSGGGVFLDGDFVLAGVFAKIYTHGGSSPQVVTHMGLAIPMDVVYDWLAENGYGFLEPEGGAGAVARGAAPR